MDKEDVYRYYKMDIDKMLMVAKGEEDTGMWIN